MYLNNLEKLEQNSLIYIYGAGSHGHNLYDSIKFYRSDIKILGFIDGFKSGKVFKLPIYKIGDFINLSSNYNYILIATDSNYWNEIKNNLEIHRLKNYLFNTFFDFDIYGEKQSGKFQNYKKYIPKVENILTNYKDKIIWKIITEAMEKCCINPVLSHINKSKSTIDIEKENDYLMGVDLKKGDIVINGGAFNGTETNDFAKSIGNEGIVYAFDPLATVEDQFNNSILNNIKVVPKALWLNKTVLFFHNNGSKTVVTTDNNKETKKIKAISIDGFINSMKINKLNFITLDVEGAELEVLRGAEKSIKKFRPRLAISIYHKLEHFFEIPLYLNEILSNYSFRLSFNDSYCIGTVIHAKPI